MERWKVKLGRSGIREAVSRQEIVAEQVDLWPHHP